MRAATGPSPRAWEAALAPAHIAAARLQELRGAPFFLAGQSMGGAVSLLAAEEVQFVRAPQGQARSWTPRGFQDAVCVALDTISGAETSHILHFDYTA